MISRGSDDIIPPPEALLWRYMDFAKLVNLLESKKLWFVRADLFEDPYEGAWSHAGVALTKAQLLQDSEISLELLNKTIGHQTHNARHMYVTCWHRNEQESAAMWRLYSRDGMGVAIKTRFSNLEKALDSSHIHCHASMVQYSDYLTNPIGIWKGWAWPFFNKRLSFEHEKEFRAIIPGLSTLGDKCATTAAFGFDIDPLDLIEAVVVHPLAQGWFKETVQNYVAKFFGTAIPVEHSPLYERPLA